MVSRFQPWAMLRFLKVSGQLSIDREFIVGWKMLEYSCGTLVNIKLVTENHLWDLPCFN